MARHLRFPLFVMFAALLISVVSVASRDGTASAAAGGPDAYIVQVQDGVSPEDVANGHGVSPRFIYRHAVNGFAGTVPPGRLDALKSDPRVVAVAIDRVVRAIGQPDGGNGNSKGKPGGEEPVVGEVLPANIARIGAVGTGYDGTGVGIAIIDTGVDLGHTDLNVATQCFDAFGGNCSDGHGHGTHVAGTAAALDNEQDVVGAAPSATIYSVRVLDSSGSGSDASVLAGIDWITKNAGAFGIRVANASLGREGTVDDNPTLGTAVQNMVAAGVIFTAAAGNDATKDASGHIPSGYADAIAVASTTAADGANLCKWLSSPIAADTASYFTTDGTKVLVSAPGEDKENVSRGCFISSVGVLSLKAGGGTTRMSGTSMAAPAVAGVAAQLVQKNRGLQVSDYTSALEAGADRTGTAPLDSPTSSYSFDGEREGVVYVPGALLLIAEPVVEPAP